jgi:hypothetical protein
LFFYPDEVSATKKNLKSAVVVFFILRLEDEMDINALYSGSNYPVVED